MIAWRITKTRHPPYDGTGAHDWGGRWSSRGRRVIYGADSFAGAILEILVHTLKPRTLPGPTTPPLASPSPNPSTCAGTSGRSDSNTWRVVMLRSSKGARRGGLALLAALVAAGAGQRMGRVCADPARPCAGFRAHDLSFVVPADGARGEDRSLPFYAVILRSGPRCSIAERQRVAAQAVFPRRKVFSARFECGGDAENNVRYSGVDARHAFLAVYAGDTPAAARRFLAEVTAGGRFPGANLRRMHAVRVHP